MQGQTFKDFPAQSHIELRFSNRDQNLLEKEEALQNYRKNVHILNKIFAYDIENKNFVKEPPIQEPQYMLDISEDNLKNMQEQLQNLVEKHTNRIQSFKSNNVIYSQRMKECSQIQNQEDLSKFLEEIQKDDLLCQDHPYLNKQSGFYKEGFQVEIKEVQNKQALIDLKESMSNDQVFQLGS